MRGERRWNKGQADTVRGEARGDKGQTQRLVTPSFFFKCNITNTSAICKRLSHAALLRDVDVNKALELFFDTLRKAAEKENLLIKTVLWVGKNAETIEKV